MPLATEFQQIQSKMILNLPVFLYMSEGSPEDCSSIEGFIDSHGRDDFVQHGDEDLGGSFA